jgi:hypothetical protein
MYMYVLCCSIVPIKSILSASASVNSLANCRLKEHEIHVVEAVALKVVWRLQTCVTSLTVPVSQLYSGHLGNNSVDLLVKWKKELMYPALTVVTDWTIFLASMANPMLLIVPRDSCVKC